MISERGLTARIETSIHEIGRDDWDSCANPRTNAFVNSGNRGWLYPFLSYDFLEALESTKCACAESGWLAQHLALEDNTGQVVAVMPCYLKSHSFGEYVFDHAWADAYERAGGRYYPKLQAAVPFTPISSPRILVRPGFDRMVAEEAITSAAIQLTDKLGVSSLHLTFVPKREWKGLATFGLLQRTSKQFHWPNLDYSSFEEFLAELTSRKRKAIRRERARAIINDVDVNFVTGSDLTEAHWDAFYKFYEDTCTRKWGQTYLNREFFSLISERMSDALLLIMAKRNGQYIAGALSFIGRDALFGRYWGEIEHHDFLHFEICFYQAIDFAIQNRLKGVEAGAGGEHKLSRGYLPTTTYSAHYVADPNLRQAIADYLEEERHYVALEQSVLNDHAPYRRTN